MSIIQKSNFVRLKAFGQANDRSTDQSFVLISLSSLLPSTFFFLIVSKTQLHKYIYIYIKHVYMGDS